MALFDASRPRWMWGLLAVLTVLLPLLAGLQYRWIGAFSEREQAYLERTLRSGALRFGDDVNAILEDAHRAFFLDSIPPDDALADTLAGRLRRWQAATAHPALLDAVYLVRFDAEAAPTLARLDADTRALRSVGWPDSLKPWFSYFTQIAARHRAASLKPPDVPVPALPPALPIPLLDDFQLDAAAASAMLATPPDYVLVLFDTAYLTDALLPALLEAHFSDGDRLAYDVLIRSPAEPAQVVYRSAPSLTAKSLSSPDLSTSAGQFRWLDVMPYALDGVVGRYVTRVRRDTALATLALRLLDDGFLDGQPEPRLLSLDPTFVDDDRREVRLVSPPPGERRLTALDQEVELNEAALPARNDTGKAWQLVLRHRAGSIEAAAQGLRRRTLGLSFGITLLLGLAAWLLAVSEQRARRLADQQMAFVAGVSHELRTPLAVIRSAAENLADGIVRDAVQARRYGHLIGQEGRRLSEMVEHTLVLAGAQAGTSYVFQSESVEALLEKAVAQVRQALGNVEVEQAIPPGLPPVRADAQALDAALRNLLVNAAKHGAAHIRVEAQFGTNGRSREVEIAVCDDGPGIPADELPHLFEPFFRGRAARAQQVPGSGVGLSVVRRTVEAHGGCVAVQSAPGRGSTFILHLPAADP